MNTLQVAYQQELSGFGEEAAHQLWGGAADLMPLQDFADITAAVVSGTAQRGVLPIEHTILGSVQSSHDAIDATPGIYAVAETVVPSHLCLLGAPDAPLAAVGDVFCHPVALSQCGRFFRANPGITVHSVLDTAASVVDVENLADPQFAVVASRVALLTHQLSLVAPDIQDRPDAQTRFLGISSERQVMPAGTPVRTTILMTVGDVPGALLNALVPLASHGVNVRRIEGRPTGEPWSYRFFVEFDHESGDAETEVVLEKLGSAGRDVRWLGTYPRWNAGRRGSIGWRSGSIPPIP
ncbi:MAG TPA: prephenate dehydratase domain-containing protein [Gemmatimonadaceae bacterium]|nr:prephenate dehydratase domain-containing protein [Gemmatimonadaceae bacterium]